MALPIYTRLGLNEPWAINAEYAQSYFPLLAQLLRGEKPVMEEDSSLNRLRNKSYFIDPSNYWDDDEGDMPEENTDLSKAPEGAIAVLSIKGLIVKDSQFCGPKGTVQLAADLRKVNQDSNYIGTIMKIESGGGQAYAIKYLSDEMLRAEKPIVVVAGNQLCSAAYFIASYADEIVSDHPLSIIGSIGTMSSMQNIQPALEKMGVEFHDVYATKSVLKNKTYNEALKGNYGSLVKNLLDPLNENFISEVINNRPKLSADGRILQGETFLANEALKLGMIDHIGDMDFAVQRVKELSKSPKSNSNSKTNMKFNNVEALAGVQNVTEDQLALANADLTAAGITNVTIVPESLITDAEAVTQERDQLTATNSTLTSDLATATAARDTAAADLATANVRITELEAENARLGAAPGATHESKVGDDTPVESTEDQEAQALIDNLPHNRKADSMFG